MSELKYYKLFHRASALTSPEFISVVEFGTGDEVYLKSEADKVIAELKAENESLLRQNRELCQALQVMYSKEEYGKLQTENESLKAKLESVQASAYADSVDAGMRERRLRRALYKACANWAHEKDARYYLKYVCISDDARIGYERWRNVERKCRAKAEEYK